MENASKALIIAGEVLLGVILLTIMVFLFRAMGAFSNAVDKNIETKSINEFNVKFEQYKGKKSITAQDIVTMGNLAKQYNEQMNSTKIEVIVYGVESKYRYAHKLNDEFTYQFIQLYSNHPITNQILLFECIKMNYNEDTGRIDYIELKKIE